MTRKLSIDYVNFIKECWIHASVSLSVSCSLMNPDASCSNRFLALTGLSRTAAIITELCTRVSPCLWSYIFRNPVLRMLLSEKN